MDRDFCLDVPAGFDDSDADNQVHPTATLVFQGRAAAEVFGKARDWVGAHDVFLTDVSWGYWHDEPEPFSLTVYFAFQTPD